MIPEVTSNLIIPFVIFGYMVKIDWRLALLSLITVPVGLFFFALMMRGSKENYENTVVKTFGQTVFSFHRFKASIDDYRDFCMHYTRMMRKSMVGYTVLINSAFVFILGLSLLLIRGENYQMDILLNFLFYVIFTPAIATTMTKVMFMSENDMKVKDAVTRMDTILSIQPLPEPKHGQEPHGASVELKDVTYRYSPDAPAAVSHLSLKAERNGIAAIVGPSGGGKTTVSRLAARFWDVSRGRITVGGRDIARIDPETLLSVYSIVFQDVTLFNNSILENIRVGKKDATDDEVLAAAKLANCDEFALKLPQGYDTVIGENGGELSGGDSSPHPFAITASRSTQGRS